MNTSEVLYRSADRMQRYGLHKGSPWAGEIGESPGCSIATINQTMRDMCAENRAWDEYGELHVAVYEAVRDYFSDDEFFCLVTWSDAPERTAEDVVAAFRAAAAVEELKEATLRGPLSTGPTVRVPSQRPSPEQAGAK